MTDNNCREKLLAATRASEQLGEKLELELGYSGFDLQTASEADIATFVTLPTDIQDFMRAHLTASLSQWRRSRRVSGMYWSTVTLLTLEEMRDQERFMRSCNLADGLFPFAREYDGSMLCFDLRRHKTMCPILPNLNEWVEDIVFATPIAFGVAQLMENMLDAATRGGDIRFWLD